jgi:Tfp pilus assembly protein PilX
MVKRYKINVEGRRGVVLACVLVCLLVVAAIGASMLRSTLEEHRQGARREHQIQAMWLAESAVQRAAARLAATPDYQGETWSLDAAALGGRWPATAVIRIETADTEPTARRIVVEARYPEDARQRVVQRRQVTIR